jgi:outer membrane protein assembly factor BamB
MNALNLVVGGLLALAAVKVDPGQVWPGFRGTGNSHSQAKDLPLRWSAAENVAWDVELPGYGQSSPVVWGDRVFVTSVAGPMQDQLLVRCVALSSGKTLWQKEFKGSQGVQSSDYVSKGAPTPALDADRLYLFFETGDLIALNHNGEVQWQRSIVQDYGPLRSNHGLGSSPVLSGDAVLLLVTHEGGSYLLAVDRKTGKNLWKRDHPFSITWASPIVAEQDGRPVILVSSSGRVDALDARAGEPLWNVLGLKGNTVPSPSVGDGLAVIGASERGSTLAGRLGGKGDVTGSHVAWRAEEVTCSFGSPLVRDGCVYLSSRAGLAYCLDLKTGKAHWDTRLSTSCWASPLASGDRIYFFSTDGGALVVRAGKRLQKLAENRFPVAGRLYGVAAVDRAFLLRTGTRLIRIGR